MNHWIAFTDAFSFPPQEFYSAVEKEITARKIPGLELSRVEYAEGGIFSDNRLYLRIIRERLAFDTCASPFGTGYFFSCRTVYSPAVVRLWHLLVVTLFFALVYYPLWRLLGTNFAAIALLGLVAALAQVFKNTVAFALADLDSALIKLPAIGPIYERWFRRDTYFRQDTRLVYLEAVPKLVKELAEEATATKGVKLVRQHQWAPVLGELYKPVSPTPKADTV